MVTDEETKEIQSMHMKRYQKIAESISSSIVQTPLISLLSSNNKNSSQKWIGKAENLQHTGSFKQRGIAHVFSCLPPDVSLVTLSAGNYGYSAACMAKTHGRTLVVCMPTGTPADRTARVQDQGATVRSVPAGDLISTVQEYVTMGFLLIHPFEDEILLEGYGTLALEILNERPQLEAIVVPVGGGGLISGISTALKELGNSAIIIGVEPEHASGQYQARVRGSAGPVENLRPTIAGGLAPPFSGPICYNRITKHVDDIVLVTEGQLKTAVCALYDQGVVVEPSGAAAYAALQHGLLPALNDCTEIVCVLSGRNMTIPQLEQYRKDVNISID